jgi:hypothetical protein
MRQQRSQTLHTCSPAVDADYVAVINQNVFRYTTTAKLTGCRVAGIKRDRAGAGILLQVLAYRRLRLSLIDRYHRNASAPVLRSNGVDGSLISLAIGTPGRPQFHK